MMTGIDKDQRDRIAEAVVIAALSALFAETVRWAFEEAKRRVRGDHRTPPEEE